MDSEGKTCDTQNNTEKGIDIRGYSWLEWKYEDWNDSIWTQHTQFTHPGTNPEQRSSSATNSKHKFDHIGQFPQEIVGMTINHVEPWKNTTIALAKQCSGR